MQSPHQAALQRHCHFARQCEQSMVLSIGALAGGQRRRKTVAFLAGNDAIRLHQLMHQRRNKPAIS
jgi:hypothetical protein